jgi:hypothetical protein
MLIRINNKDLAYTIDTYGMFTGENVDVQEAEHYREMFDLTDDEFNSIEFDYDHPGVVKDLAISSVGLLNDELVGSVVKSINLVSTGSPRFYNYTTDWYVAEWNLNTRKLEAYVQAKLGKFNSFLREHWTTVYYAHGTEDFNKENYIVASLDFYTREEYSPEDYLNSMFEHEHVAWYENTELTPASQDLIDQKMIEYEAKQEQERNQVKLGLGG